MKSYACLFVLAMTATLFFVGCGDDASDDSSFDSETYASEEGGSSATAPDEASFVAPSQKPDDLKGSRGAAKGVSPEGDDEGGSTFTAPDGVGPTAPNTKPDDLKAAEKGCACGVEDGDDEGGSTFAAPDSVGPTAPNEKPDDLKGGEDEGPGPNMIGPKGAADAEGPTASAPDGVSAQAPWWDDEKEKD
jgi:hypothetical protein